nr:retrovirus-related Pol polyprotein from transposon TNT 1-94 [Tanacetum cinerariifolium]
VRDNDLEDDHMNTLPFENTSEIPVESESLGSPPELIPVRRSERTTRVPNRLCLNIEVEDDEVRDLEEPANYKAAMLDPDKVVRSKWLYKKKIDMDDIRAIRILIAIAAYYDYEIWQMDVKTTFLNGRLDEDIYMEQPEGRKTDFRDRVMRIWHSAYGRRKTDFRGRVVRIWYSAYGRRKTDFIDRIMRIWHSTYGRRKTYFRGRVMRIWHSTYGRWKTHFRGWITRIWHSTYGRRKTDFRGQVVRIWHSAYGRRNIDFRARVMRIWHSAYGRWKTDFLGRVARIWYSAYGRWKTDFRGRVVRIWHSTYGRRKTDDGLPWPGSANMAFDLRQTEDGRRTFVTGPDDSPGALRRLLGPWIVLPIKKNRLEGDPSGGSASAAAAAPEYCGQNNYGPSVNRWPPALGGYANGGNYAPSSGYPTQPNKPPAGPRGFMLGCIMVGIQIISEEGARRAVADSVKSIDGYHEVMYKMVVDGKKGRSSCGMTSPHGP